MATKFDKVTLDKIEQGGFMMAAEAAFQDVIDALIQHIDQHTHGSEELKAKFKAKSELKLTVGIEFSKGVYHLKTEIHKSLPKRPAGISSAFCNEDPESSDRLCLFSQAGGTAKGNPHQMTIPMAS